MPACAPDFSGFGNRADSPRPLLVGGGGIGIQSINIIKLTSCSEEETVMRIQGEYETSVAVPANVVDTPYQ